MIGFWTPERIGTLCRRYRDGERFEDIAPHLGCTRNAAIGKFNRLVKERHPLALEAKSIRDADGSMTRVADWMAAYGGSIADCARQIGMSYNAALKAWNRVRAGLGEQAA